MAARDALEMWGIEAQLRMLQEECGELVAAVNRFMRGRGDPHDVIEEIADVGLMIEEMKVIFDARELFDAEGRKLQRLQKRLLIDRIAREAAEREANQKGEG